MASLVNKSSINKVVSQLLAVLNVRSKDVINRRFGLKSGQKETLDSIGKGYGITRERVRQIEAVAIKQMRELLKSGFQKNIEPYLAMASSILEEHGGTLKDRDFFEKFFGNLKDKTSMAALTLIMTLNGTPKNYAETDDTHNLWTLSDGHIESAQKISANLVSLLEKHEEPIHEDSILASYKKASIASVDPKAFLAAVNFSKNISKNIFGEIGLASWSSVKPRGVRDKAYLVVKRDGNPQHFRQIAKMINAAGFSDRKANVQTVHNELIKDNRFVLVGRGTYGLTEWGCKAGTVKEVLVDLLRSAKKPLHKTELVSQVLSHRMVKENTIVLNLQDSKTFKKTENGHYTLREA